MRNKIIIIAAMIATIILINISQATAGNEWEMTIKAKVLTAENKLIIGQKPDANDGVDGKYDVPALLAGDIEAYTEVTNKKLWKDIKKSCTKTCQKTWNIFVESTLTGSYIELTWNLLDTFTNMRITLMDVETGNIINMTTTNKYSFKNTGKKAFIIKVQK